MRARITAAAAANSRSAAVADLAAVDLLERADAAGPADAVEHGRARRVACCGG